MKRILLNQFSLVLVTLFILGSGAIFGQNVESIELGGERYFVYPFRQEVNILDEYWKVVDDDAFFADYNNYFNLFSGDFIFSRESFQNAKTEKRKEYLQKELENRWKRIRGSGSFGGGITKAIRNRPGELIEVSYSHEKDLLPPFGKIPDGKYVQLFQDFCIPDSKGKCQFNQNRVAGYFTVKNNVLEGEAIWMNFNGDTLKQGFFLNGLKEGDWILRTPTELGYQLSRNNKRELKRNGRIEHIYAIEYGTYKNGLNHGPYLYEGFYKWQEVSGSHHLGIPVGEWKYFTDSQLTIHMSIVDRKDTIISKKPIIRGNELVKPRSSYFWNGRKMERYDLDCRDAAMPEFPMYFYSINFKKTKSDIELAGEDFKSIGLKDEYGNDEITPFRYRNNARNATEYDFQTGISFPRWLIIDSLGARMRYEGVFEQFYTNGQLFFRYEFKDGHLVEESPIYWDNGTKMDVITFQPDSNKYYRSLYDRNGRLYDIIIYDSIGKFIEYYDSLPRVKTVIKLDGLLVHRNDFQSHDNFDVDPVWLYYRDRDTLKSENLTGTVILTRTWAYPDTSIQLNNVYDPLTHQHVSERYNCFGEVHKRMERTFTEDFSGWTGNTWSKYGEFSVNSVWSGVQLQLDEIDTLQHRNVYYAFRAYDVSSDILLKRNDQNYTGEFRSSSRNGVSKFKIKSNSINLRISKGFHGYNKHDRFATKKRAPNKFMLESITNNASLKSTRDDFRADFYKFFSALLYDQNGYLSYSVYDNRTGLYGVKGQFLDGKAHGIWTAYDRKGKVVSTINFKNGEPDGEARIYNDQQKEPRRSYYFDNYSNIDTFPKHDMRYLKNVIHYKNGMREGLSIEYDWLGRTVKSCNYVQDYQDGKMISRDSQSHTEATFKDGRLNGYLKTYLTFPRRDSILLYDINLQHGLLNGESRSYHTNGRLAKRGFFLDGEPIDDYESYDTLGFRFHYVKFKFSQPVEEKIWEENALSIRYLFNWEDSIEFRANDITSTKSLDALLVKEGYKTYTTKDKYYGRMSLISKSDIECQMTKYYPNDTIARDGRLKNMQKIGLWKFYGYNGNFLYEANYFDSIIVINDSIRFMSKGILTDYDDAGNRLYSAYIIEKFEKYDCAHTDHYEVRQLITIDEVHDSLGRMNGHVQNFYDNGTLQAEGTMKNGIPDGLWHYYDPYGKLNKMGNYTMGKRNGRWLEGDLAKKKYLGEICMNPNLEDLEAAQNYQENLLDITILNYMMGKLMKTQFYDLNMNRVLEIQENKR